MKAGREWAFAVGTFVCISVCALANVSLHCTHATWLSILVPSIISCAEGQMDNKGEPSVSYYSVRSSAWNFVIRLSVHPCYTESSTLHVVCSLDLPPHDAPLQLL